MVAQVRVNIVTGATGQGSEPARFTQDREAPTPVLLRAHDRSQVLAQEEVLLVSKGSAGGCPSNQASRKRPGYTRIEQHNGNSRSVIVQSDNPADMPQVEQRLRPEARERIPADVRARLSPDVRRRLFGE